MMPPSMYLPPAFRMITAMCWATTVVQLDCNLRMAMVFQTLG